MMFDAEETFSQGRKEKSLAYALSCRMLENFTMTILSIFFIMMIIEIEKVEYLISVDDENLLISISKEKAPGSFLIGRS